MSLTRVQNAPNGSESGSATSLVLTFPAPMTAGNLVELWVGWDNQAATITSITGGGTYTNVLTKYDDTGGNGSIAGYILKQIGASPGSTVTVNFSAGAICDARATEWSGQDTTTQPDAGPAAGRTQSGIGSTADAVASNSITTVTDGAYVVGYAFCTQGGGFGSLDAGTGFTADGVNPADSSRGRGVYALKASAGTLTPKWTATGATSSSFASSAMAIRPAGTTNSVLVGNTPKSGPGISPTKSYQFIKRPLSSQNSNFTVFLTGTAATFAQGNAGVADTLTITGQQISFSQGAASPSNSTTPVGKTYIPGPGVSPDYRQLFQARKLSGGAPAAPANSTITGVVATFSTGTLVGNDTLILSGLQSTFSQGTVSVNTAGPITISIAGQSATFNQGFVGTSGGIGAGSNVIVGFLVNVGGLLTK